MRFHSINFQLQAMVTFVTIASLLLLGIVFQITQEISFNTNQLSKSAELNSLIKEWETELNIGIRSRIKYISLQKPVFLTNYTNSILRIQRDIYDQIRALSGGFSDDVQVGVSHIWKKQIKYNSLASELNNQFKKVGTSREKHIALLEQIEAEIKEDLQRFLQISMVNVRKQNLQKMEKTMSSSNKLMFLVMASFIIVYIFIWLLLKKKILAPLKLLEKGAKEIGEGALGLQINVHVRNEIGDLVNVLNKMSIQLKKNQDALVKLKRLETIGQVTTSVNHEINNPLMVISGNAEYLNNLVGPGDEDVSKKLTTIIEQCRRIFEVTQKLKGIKNPVVDRYVGEESTMIDLKRSS